MSKNVKEVRFGELILTFTDRFEERWSDRGSGADKDAAFYHPIPPTGFFALGSIGRNDHSTPDGNVAALCVKEATPGSGALKPPVDWQFIWNDVGSGADQDGACWRPIPPKGYVALGDVFIRGYERPTGQQVMCVREDLVFAGTVSTYSIWTDAGSGADRDFGAWEIGVSAAFRDTPDILIAANTFVGHAHHEKPSAAAVVYTLRLPIPTIESGEPGKPTLTSKTKPAEHTNPVVDRIVTVPFTAVTDGGKSLAWKVANSPFYTLERSVQYDLLIFDDNNTSVPQTKSHNVTTGISKESSETFSINTGISVTVEEGVDVGGFSSKVSATVSVELGYAQTTSVTKFESTEIDAELTTPPERAAALWTEAHSIRVARADGSSVSAPLTFKAGHADFMEAQYPPPSFDAPKAARIRRFPNRRR